MLRILETAAEMAAVETLQRQVWGMTDVVPSHLLLTAAHNGGLVIGAWVEDNLVGFVFGFPGIVSTPQGARLKHCSHMLGVHPEFQNKGIGYKLKRAQWQMVRRQGVDLITWTYDPLLSRNAKLNIDRLGAVCHTYYVDYYGDMSDELNVGLPSDRFQVELWVNSPRVEDRMKRTPRRSLDLGHYLAVGATILNPTRLGEEGWPLPAETSSVLDSLRAIGERVSPSADEQPPIYLVEIPAEFQAFRNINQPLALQWRMHTRAIFQELFARGYLITDFVYLPGSHPRSFYVLTDGSRTLG